MTEKNKPKWVEALESAESELHAAGAAETPEERDSRTRLAYGWLDIAREYRANPAA